MSCRNTKEQCNTTAVALTAAVAIRGTGSVHRRTGMQTARTLAVDSGSWWRERYRCHVMPPQPL